jgi:hypothetical protein
MRKNHRALKYCFAMLAMFLVFTLQAQEAGEKWSEEKAWEWYNDNPWICGFNYIPANAINYTAMWDKTGFGPTTISQELDLAKEVGFNTVRVVLQFIVWEDDPRYFKQTFQRFLSICSSKGIKVMPALFDDCAFGTNIDPSLGQQPEPLEGWYAWAWSPSPGHTMVRDHSTHPRLEKYVKDVIETFKDNPAILLWDLYNEPTCTMNEPGVTLPLLRKVFKTAREVNPSQPLSICVFGNDEMREFITDNSDIITFHSYAPLEGVKRTVEALKEYKRPMINTEWLNRPRGSLVETILPYFYEENVGCLHWGLVNGKTQTDLPWGHRPGDLPFNGMWQHDLYTSDFEEYSRHEIRLFKSYISQSLEKQTSTTE